MFIFFGLVKARLIFVELVGFHFFWVIFAICVWVLQVEFLGNLSTISRYTLDGSNLYILF